MSDIVKEVHSDKRGKVISDLYTRAQWCKDFLAYYQYLVKEVHCLSDAENRSQLDKDSLAKYQYLVNELRNLSSYVGSGEGLLSGYYMMKLTSEEPVDSQFHELKHLRKALDKAFREGRLSETEYNLRTKELDRKLNNYEAEHIQWLKHTYENTGLTPPKVQSGHIVLELKCDCGWKGCVTAGKRDAMLLGKDTKEGYTYFECPLCKRHLRYCWFNGKQRPQD